jgi:predicted glycoside hydrolase/deacetylase ChbG (UPF0249 family)
VKRIILCADDYGFSPGVSKAIRDLVGEGRLNATSVMTIFPGFAEEAEALAQTPSPLRAQFGLHLTLSGGYAPLTVAPLTTRDGKLPSINRLLSPLARFKINREAAAREIEAQIKKFTQAFGRPPDFVDGHQHVHLMPGIRKPFLETVAKLAPKAWVRQCGPAKMRALITADNKTRVIGVLNAAFKSQVRRLGLKTNSSFSGAYSFAGSDKFSDLFPRFLNELTDGGVMMCHPGFADAALRERDTLVERRDEEYAYLAGDEFDKAMKAAGATLV